MRLIVLAAALLFTTIFHSPAQAQVTGARVNVIGGDLYSYQDVLLVQNGYAFPVSPLTPTTKELKVVPLYATLEAEFETFGESNNIAPPDLLDDAQGFGLALSYFQGINDHWGFSLLGAWGQLKGETLGIQESSNSSNPGFFGGSFSTDADDGTILGYEIMDKKGFGIQGAAALIYDPFTDPEGFRLPLMIGLSAMYMSQKANLTFFSQAFQEDLEVSIKQSNFLPGLFLGVSAQFKTGPVRWVPFFSSHSNFKTDSREFLITRKSDGTVLLDTSESEEESLKPTLGISINYIPWDLGISIIPSFFSLFGKEGNVKINVFSVTKVFKF